MENTSEMLPVVKIKKEAMDVKPFELEDPTDVLQVVLRVKEELSDAEDLLYEPLEMENSTEFAPVLEIKEELLDVKDELLPGHYFEASPAHIMDGCNVDSVNIKPEHWSDEDPLSTAEKQSGYDSAVKASCDYKPLEDPKSEFYCKRKTSKNKELNISALYNEGKPASCVIECDEIGMHTVPDLGKRKYICDECEKCFTVRRSFVAHLQTHSKRKHKCQDCGKCFTGRSDLLRHSVIHSGERKHKCEDCGKYFTHQRNLVSHLLIHSGERKHKCQDCGKCFTHRRNLVNHFVSHSGERRHKCEGCGQCFKRRNDLVRHSLIHSGEKYKDLLSTLGV